MRTAGATLSLERTAAAVQQPVVAASAAGNRTPPRTLIEDMGSDEGGEGGIAFADPSGVMQAARQQAVDEAARGEVRCSSHAVGCT